MNSIVRFVIFAFVACLSGCIPVSVATIRVGDARTLDDMIKAETAIESLGCLRIWSEAPNSPPAARAEYQDDVVSNFEFLPQKGFGASVILRKKDGALLVRFAERNNRFSEQGRVLLAAILSRLRDVFGDAVELSMSSHDEDAIDVFASATRGQTRDEVNTRSTEIDSKTTQKGHRNS